MKLFYITLAFLSFSCSDLSVTKSNCGDQLIEITGRVSALTGDLLSFETEYKTYRIIIDGAKVKLPAGTTTIHIECRDGDYYLVL